MSPRLGADPAEAMPRSGCRRPPESSPAAPRGRGASLRTCFRRRPALFTLASLAALMLGTAAPAQAQTTIWTSTLTVGVHSSQHPQLVGFTNGNGSLTDSDFVINGVTYTVNIVQLDTGSGNLRLSTSPQIPNDDRTNLALHVGTTKFDFPSGTGLMNWPNSGLSWSSGDTISLKIVDSIPPGVVVTPTGFFVTEGDTTGASYSVVLRTEPTGSVTVTVGGHSGTDLTVSPATLTFTTSNWSTAQTVTVTAAQDADSVNDTVTLTHGVSGYGTVTTGDSVSVTVADDEGLLASCPAPSLTGRTQSGRRRWRLGRQLPLLWCHRGSGFSRVKGPHTAASRAAIVSPSGREPTQSTRCT